MLSSAPAQKKRIRPLRRSRGVDAHSACALSLLIPENQMDSDSAQLPCILEHTCAKFFPHRQISLLWFAEQEIGTCLQNAVLLTPLTTDYRLEVQTGSSLPTVTVEKASRDALGRKLRRTRRDGSGSDDSGPDNMRSLPVWVCSAETLLLQVRARSASQAWTWLSRTVGLFHVQGIPLLRPHNEGLREKQQISVAKTGCWCERNGETGLLCFPRIELVPKVGSARFTQDALCSQQPRGRIVWRFLPVYPAPIASSRDAPMTQAA